MFGRTGLCQDLGGNGEEGVLDRKGVKLSSPPLWGKTAVRLWMVKRKEVRGLHPLGEMGFGVNIKCGRTEKTVGIFSSPGLC